MTEMTKLAQTDTKLMVELTKRASRKAEGLKMITMITMLYLPATFVAVSHRQHLVSWEKNEIG